MEEDEKFIARPCTLGEMISRAHNANNIMVINELNETLIVLDEIENYVCNPVKFLAKDFLKREVISYAVEGYNLFILIKGEEDAE